MKKIVKRTMYVCLALGIVALGTLFGIIMHKSNIKVSYKIDYAKEAELKYFAAKSEYIDAVQDYITKTAPYSGLTALELVTVCEEYNLDVIFALAQGEVESKFGTIGAASKTNSVWNVGAFDATPVDRILNRYKYNHPNASIRPYAKLLHERYLVGKTEYDLMDKFVDVNGNRYASSTTYESVLSGKYNSIVASTDIRDLQTKMNFYAIKCNR